MVAARLAAQMPVLEAEHLVEEAQAFSEEAWSQIYDQHYVRLFDYCYARTGNRAAAEDLAAEVFLEAVRGIRGYRYRGVPFAAWLYRIARNLTADHLQRNARRPQVSLVEEADHPQLREPDGTEHVADRHDIQAALRRLSDDQQQVLILRFFQGLSHDETAAVMGRRTGAVRVLQTRALSALRRVMAA